MFFSCIEGESGSHTDRSSTISLEIKKGPAKTETALTLDAFIFDNAGRLDCYQRIEDPGLTCTIASGSGDKTLLLIANSDKDRYDWVDIRTLQSASLITVDIENERREHPIMTCLQKITAGKEISIDLHPLRCEILLRTLRCDFSTKPYKDQKLTDVKVYLTHANASSSIMPDCSPPCYRLINPGMLDMKNLECFLEKELIVQEIADDIGSVPVKTDCSLFCYGNEPEKESIGSPFTRIVIEGKIDGDVYYYPIKINPEGGGVKSGCRYVLDIVITKAGAVDPDGGLEETAIEIITETEEWKEKDWYDIRF